MLFVALLELVAFWPLTGSADIARSHTSMTRALDRMLMRPVHRPIAPVPSAAHPILMTGEPFRNWVTSDELLFLLQTSDCGSLQIDTMAPLKLIYFDIPGKAEAIRLCASVGKVDFEDVRISRERFAEMKEQGALPYGQVPALDVGAGRMLAQSSAILRYVATLGGLHPSDPLEAARIDSIMSEEEDFFSGITISRYSARFGYGHMSDEFRAEVRKNLNDEILPKHLRFLEALLADSKTGWLAGTEKPSAADFVFVPRLRWLVSGANDGIDGNLLDGFPMVKEFIAKMMALPPVVDWYAKNPPPQ